MSSKNENIDFYEKYLKYKQKYKKLQKELKNAHKEFEKGINLHNYMKEKSEYKFKNKDNTHNRLDKNKEIPEVQSINENKESEYVNCMAHKTEIKCKEHEDKCVWDYMFGKQGPKICTKK